MAQPVDFIIVFILVTASVTSAAQVCAVKMTSLMLDSYWNCHYSLLCLICYQSVSSSI